LGRETKTKKQEKIGWAEKTGCDGQNGA
jgi:hypothetical protein